MGKKGVEDLIQEIEVFIGQCKYQPLSSNKIVVPKDEIERLLNELKMKLPSEIERCRKIMRNKEAILASARTRSDAIISESVNEANRLVDSNHITELANIRAGEIVDAAKAEAQRIVSEATAEATEVRLSGMLYTKQKISEMKEFMAATLEAENENYRNLCESLENNVYTMESNLSELDASINLINGSSQQPAQAGQQEAYQAPAYTDDEFDEEEEEYEEDGGYEEEYEEEDEYEDEEEDDFLDE